MTAGRICARCQGPLGSRYRTIIPHSMSGARPNQHTHHPDDPRCRPTTEAERERGH
ncbi:hypothetical protein [Streptomyces sp. NPDC054865]